MSFIKSRFKVFLQVRRSFVLLGFFVLLSGLTPIAAKNATSDDKRRIGRVQATYLTHLINLTQWNKDHLPTPSQSPKIVILGDEENGFTESLEFLLEQSGIGIGGNKIEILHFRNGDKIKANAALENKPQIVFFLSSSNYDPKKMRELSKHSLFVGNGRKFITELKGDIAFNYSRNRVRLIISKLALTRRSPKLNSQISRLRSVVEIIP